MKAELERAYNALDEAGEALRKLRNVCPKGEWRKLCDRLGVFPHTAEPLMRRERS